MKNKKKTDNTSEEEVKRQIQLIHRLARRLPWIVVFFVALAAIVTMIEVFFSLY